MSEKAAEFVQLLHEQERNTLQQYAVEYDHREQTQEQDEDKKFYSKLRVGDLKKWTSECKKHVM